MNGIPPVTILCEVKMRGARLAGHETQPPRTPAATVFERLPTWKVRSGASSASRLRGVVEKFAVDIVLNQPDIVVARNRYNFAALVPRA